MIIYNKLMDLFGGPFFTPLFREGKIPMAGRKPQPLISQVKENAILVGKMITMVEDTLANATIAHIS